MAEWTTLLANHPIFRPPPNFPSNELSASTSANPTGQRQLMVLKDADLVVAVGEELRIASLGASGSKGYKTLHTPNLQFEIRQLALNPSGKLLAVAGECQIGVVVLPRSGYARLVPETIDCKSLQIGQFYHAAKGSPPIAKIQWHPWGEAGSTLMVMTEDGKLREYDISTDADEPQQVLSFVPERKGKAFVAEDASEREVASFSLGQGQADWGPLTVYAVMKSGDIYAMCPYMPKNAAIPSSYVHSLECFISAKQEFLAQSEEHGSTSSRNLSVLYDYQRKYISALIKQLPPGTVFPATSRSVSMHPPTTLKAKVARQGPFLLQPAPRSIAGSEGGDATDMIYLAFGSNEQPEADSEGGETGHLGVVLVAYQDGKVDLCLDVEKVEARWDTGSAKRDAGLPMLAVYETIDLDLVTMLAGKLNLLQGNRAVFLADPLHDDTIYVYHAFGVHSLHLDQLLQTLRLALKADDEAQSLTSALQEAVGSSVTPIVSTFSVERSCSNPVVAVLVPNDIFVTYSILVLTSAMRIVSIPLDLRSAPPAPKAPVMQTPASPSPQKPTSKWLIPRDGPPSYISLLGNTPYTPPECLTRTNSGLPLSPRLSLPPSPTKGAKDFMLTPEVLRYLGKTVADLTGQMQEVQLAFRAADSRVLLQQNEQTRLAQKCEELSSIIARLKGPQRQRTEERLARVQEEQKSLHSRLERLLRGLMDRASPELSEYETKWFAELKRLQGEVVGASKYDETSLLSRMQVLEREYERLMPGLKALVEKERIRKTPPPALGVSQAFEFGARSNIEHARISKMEDELVRLAGQLNLSLSHPPERES
ncbi:hypothetical protein MIND_00705700 [Mycena indigotica]|uniref:Uncharacterized protein n=1 Tax=Mycena indigotica TaxID=2126181 RepID=A0A8H6SP47_9AGAR|nr:uncharacterized protein MIND_00705700 [Mycena indigotica]KAF7301405.1 hypothetical protein MIND_00705700 [Mycena indigotica]